VDTKGNSKPRKYRNIKASEIKENMIKTELIKKYLLTFNLFLKLSIPQ
jgi:hypothetical protein